MMTHGLSKEFEICFLVAFLCDKAFKHFTILINGLPNIVYFTISQHENLVQMPTPLIRLHPSHLSFFSVAKVGPNLLRQNRMVS